MKTKRDLLEEMSRRVGSLQKAVIIDEESLENLRNSRNAVKSEVEQMRKWIDIVTQGIS